MERGTVWETDDAETNGPACRHATPYNGRLRRMSLRTVAVWLVVVGFFAFIALCFV